MNPEPIINILFALRDRLGKRATIVQAIGVLKLIQAGDTGLTASELVICARSGTSSTTFVNNLVKAGLVKKTVRIFHSQAVCCLVATPRALELL